MRSARAAKTIKLAELVLELVWADPVREAIAKRARAEVLANFHKVIPLLYKYVNMFSGKGRMPYEHIADSDEYSCVLQEVMVAHNSWYPDMGKWSTFMAVVVRNMFIKQREHWARRHAHTRILSGNAAAEYAVDTRGYRHSDELPMLRWRIDFVLCQLHLRYRYMLAARYLMGQSSEKIRPLFGISKQAFSQRMIAARERFLPPWLRAQTMSYASLKAHLGWRDKCLAVISEADRKLLLDCCHTSYYVGQRIITAREAFMREWCEHPDMEVRALSFKDISWKGIMPPPVPEHGTSDWQIRRTYCSV